MVFVDLEEQGIGYTDPPYPLAWEDCKVKFRKVAVPKSTVGPLRWNDSDDDISDCVQKWVEERFARGDEFEE